MLVSHRYRFIFLKSVKTAGTSVESHFEKYCYPHGEWKPSHYTEEYINLETGIVGYRGLNRTSEHKFYNHMPASQLRSSLGQDIWNSYFKFTVVRNPFDRLVSYFYHVEMARKSNYKAMPGGDVAKFRRWLRTTGGVSDKHIYTIGDRLAVDNVIRFESLKDSIGLIRNKLDLPSIDGDFALPNYKSEFRPKNMTADLFYDDEHAAIVQRNFNWELQEFGYGFPSTD